MELKKSSQSESDMLYDKPYACMETGNVGRARTIMGELRDTNLVLYTVLHTDILREYGISL